MTIPAKIKIKQIPDYYTKTIGKYAHGQFVAMITATLPVPLPKNWEKHKHWYAVLHTFTEDGEHQNTDAWLAGTTSEGEDDIVAKARIKRDEMVSSLEGHTFCDVEVKLFSVQINGFTFGLIDASKKEEGYESVHLLPNDIAFFSPWDGSFDT